MGGGYLIIRVTCMSQSKNIKNDALVVPFAPLGSNIPQIASGQMILHSKALPVTLQSNTDNAGTVVNVLAENYVPPVLGGGGADPGLVSLVTDLPLP